MKFKFYIIAAMIFICGATAGAYDFEYNGFYYNIKSLTDMTVSLTASENCRYSGDIIIPTTAEYSGKTFTVVHIEEDAFKTCYINKIVVPSNILGGKIDTGDGFIQTVTIEDSDIPLNGLDLGGNIKNVYIGRNAEDSFSLTMVGSAVESATFGDGVTVIGHCFTDCENLTTVIMPNVRIINGNAFANCKKLKEISGPKVEIISGWSAFENCTSLESFSFPMLKTMAGGQGDRFGVFENCTSLKNVVLPSGLVTIGSVAFKNCSNLGSVVLPASIMRIYDGYNGETSESNIFSNCEKLTSVTANSKNPLSIPENTFDQMTYVKATLKVPVGALEAYQKADVWKNFFNITEDASINDDVVGVLLEDDSYWDEDGKVYIKNPNQVYHVGDEITIVFEPAEEYAVSEVWVNGKNMVSQVVDNILTFTLEGNTRISASFSWHYVPEVSYYLSIKQGENGCVKMKVDKWDSYCFIIEPEADSKIHSVTYNGEDITEKVIDNEGEVYIYDIDSDVVLNIAFESSNVGVAALKVSNARVIGEEGAIKITGYDEGEDVSVYDISGQVIQSKTLEGHETHIPVQTGQVYIVKVEGKIVKIAI